MYKEQEFIHLEGSVESVIYRNDDNGYIVLELANDDELITVVGELGSVQIGEELRLTGTYITHAKYGTQFKAEVCERRLPTSAASIRRYLASGIVKGVGPAMSKRIVDHFGDETLDIIEQEPERLSEVKGISDRLRESIAEEFKQIFGIRTVMVYLSKFGIAPSFSVRAWKKWGKASIDIIGENPFELCSPGIEMDFIIVDKIASEFQFAEDNINRIRAGISYVLIRNANSGHTCLPLDRLTETACALLNIDEDKFNEAIEIEIDDGVLCELVKRGRSFIYLREYYDAENYIAGRLAIIKHSFPKIDKTYENEIDRMQVELGIKYESLQRQAISLALSRGALILTGGPGTGKTTTLNAIISIFKQKGDKVLIAAPTGRAAKRISELTGYEAKTIHRLLEVGYSENGNMKFLRCEENLLDSDVIIIDEMSMVDTLLFEALLKAMRLSCRIIMVGDSDQLPSVGAGNVLKDLIESGMLTLVELKEIFRQAAQSRIVTNAHRIVAGDMPDLATRDSDFFFMQRLDPHDAEETIVELCAKRLPKTYKFSPIDDIQVLTPNRRGTLGSLELNTSLQAQLNPPHEERTEITYGDIKFRDGDKVMQVRNNYDIEWDMKGEKGAGIYNGDIGIIKMIDKRTQTVVIDFEGKIAHYNFDLLLELELAYAITVHKSQGSEFDAVIIPVLGGYDKLYFRNLLYTGVTRAKKLLILVGSKNRIAFMVKNDRKTLRYTGLRFLIERQLERDKDEGFELFS